MGFTTILRRSASKVAPLTKFLTGATSNTHSVVTLATMSAVERAAFSPFYIRTGAYSSNRRFCSVSETSSADSSYKTLLEVLQSEVDVVVQSDDYGKSVNAPADFPFAIEDNPGEQTVTLTREYDGEIVSVEVSMPNLITGDEDDEEDDNEDADGPNTDSNVPLLVTITKKEGSGPFLEFDCTAVPDEIRINGLSLKNPETEDSLAYEGPDFFDLDENLQKAFHKYLEIRGIKPSTTNFLHEYMIEKDNKEYLRWLKDVKNFVEA